MTQFGPESTLTTQQPADRDRQLADLTIQIRAGLPSPTPPTFVELVEHAAERVTLPVPLYTDIPDPELIADSVRASESA